MFLERLLRHPDAKRPFINPEAFCAFWREILRGRGNLTEFRIQFEMDDIELRDFQKILINPYKEWTRHERILMTYMANDLMDISNQRGRVREPMTVLQFMKLIQSPYYEKGEN